LSCSGLLLVDKPSGPTSHDVVARVRRLAGERRVGHAGTLDPAAAGLLPLVLGPATRLVRFLPASPKLYSGILVLGLSTDTDDLAGTVVRRHTGPPPPAEAVREAGRSLLGESLQAPPAVSARKVGGERLYRLARRGVAASAPSRPVCVTRFDLEPTADPARFGFVVEVSSGTYVRALARDLGARLGCGGALAKLLRERIGPMHLDAAIGLDALERSGRPGLLQRLLPPERMPLALPQAVLARAAAEAEFRSGRAVPVEDAPEEGLCRLVLASGSLLGVAEMRGGRAHPRVVLPAGPA